MVFICLKEAMPLLTLNTPSSLLMVALVKLKVCLELLATSMSFLSKSSGFT